MQELTLILPGMVASGILAGTLGGLPPPFNAPPGRVGMEAANELFPFFKPRPEGRGR